MTQTIECHGGQSWTFGIQRWDQVSWLRGDSAFPAWLTASTTNVRDSDLYFFSRFLTFPSRNWIRRWIGPPGRSLFPLFDTCDTVNLTAWCDYRLHTPVYIDCCQKYITNSWWIMKLCNSARKKRESMFKHVCLRQSTIDLRYRYDLFTKSKSKINVIPNKIPLWNTNTPASMYMYF